MSQVIGKATVYADGMKLEMENGAKANAGGVAREFDRHGGRTYFRESETFPFVEGVMKFTKDTNPATINAIKDATIIFHCDTGQQYVMSGAAIENPIDIDAGSGTSPVRFVGDQWDEM